ncbi:GNAT family N-acetyltransferase [Kaistella sp. DKR-2]|uniref:GNAT family N-acetyltransferase n=1 Tax=Kaistella soli TaxID=2849654 RepID=UPI001C2775DA|nr:GNAT family N-acetyltransferase [Kaistella soli]MBU8883090.1 GNAT family N-acetyltransferase [Kaistella soli]
MESFIFDFKQDISFTESFLATAATAHGEQMRTKDWFLWKFRDNPFGESILACAKENDQIIGCVAFGMQDFVYEGKVIKAALSFETFVHPDHQGNGIFKRLIDVAETEARRRKIVFLLNFPNFQSLPGFIKSGWSNINCAEYWIRPNSLLKLILRIRELKTSFSPTLSGYVRKDIEIEELSRPDSSFKSVINREYILWRFFKYPVAEYAVIQQDSFLTLGRVGKRGTLKEVQVLFAEDSAGRHFSVSELFNLYKKESGFDLLSFPISRKNKIRNKLMLNFFIKVPSQTNVTFKILDEDYDLDFTGLELSAINYHTY